ncbi:MAG: hypothetical protein JKY53_01750 [Flavobacteriales bacterium]|nr:hypothetical protein [Flavobacteriales bacterium]
MKQLTLYILLLTTITPVIAQNDNDTASVDKPRYYISVGVMMQFFGDRYDIKQKYLNGLLDLGESNNLSRNAMAYIHTLAPIVQLKKTSLGGASQSLKAGYWFAKESYLRVRSATSIAEEEIKMNHVYLFYEYNWPIKTWVSSRNRSVKKVYVGAGGLIQQKKMTWTSYAPNYWRTESTHLTYSTVVMIPVGMNLEWNRLVVDINININVLGWVNGELRTRVTHTPLNGWDNSDTETNIYSALLYLDLGSSKKNLPLFGYTFIKFGYCFN